MIELRDRLIVALDVLDTDEAFRIVEKLGDAVNFYKVGLQLQFVGGIEFAKRLTKYGKKVFLDSKIYDIDTTVTKAISDISKIGVDFVTVCGDINVKAAVNGKGNSSLKVLSVTRLTSFDADEDIVRKYAKEALEAGCDGVIASGQEALAIQKIIADKTFLIVCPGIRSKGISKHDQKRASTPYEAIKAGADYLVVGRQILESNDQKGMVGSIFDEINSALIK